jgi:gamma-glutamyltranspeptidase/glutathione hydrolase
MKLSIPTVFSMATAIAVAVACSPAPVPQPPPPTTATVIAPTTASLASAPVDAGAPPHESVWPYTSPVVVKGTHGMVVTDNATASKVGSDVLASGGNAADAAVATAFALAVAYPTAGNVGGGGFAVTRMHGESRSLDFREMAPSAATRDMYVDGSGKAKPEAREGILSVGVPGSVAGLWELHQKLGSKKKTWAELLAPAIKLAEEGFVIDDGFESTMDVAGKRLLKHPVSAALFFPDGSPRAK